MFSIFNRVIVLCSNYLSWSLTRKIWFHCWFHFLPCKKSACLWLFRSMSNQQRACELLRQAAQILEQESVSVNRTTASLCTDVSTPTTPTTAHSAALRLATRNLFTPYGSARGRTRMPPQPRVTFWSHRFCALARSDQVCTFLA